MMILDQVSNSRDNNFNLIRMIAASAVLVSHAFVIALGPEAEEPLEALTGRSLGWTSVAVFFAISGFLISRSFDRTARLENWFVARILRLFPGLLVVVLLTVFVLGPLTTTLPIAGYFGDGETAAYILRNLTLAFLQYDLPGVFRDNPYPGAINGSLWTLIHEVLCYFGVLLIGLAGAFRSTRTFLIFAAVYVVVYTLTAAPAVQAVTPYKALLLRDLSFPFFCGTVFYAFRAKILLDWRIAIAAAVPAFALLRFTGAEELYLIWICYAVFWLAYSVGGGVRAYNKLGDYSYGIYIYAFPVQQLAVYYFGPMTPLENILIAFPAALFLAVLSWRFIESPSLAVRFRVSDWAAGALGRKGA